MRRSTYTKRFLLASLLAATTGCSSTGSFAGLNPFATRSAPETAVAAQLSDESSVPAGQAGWLSPIQKVADGARGQVGSMSLAVQSAYGKAKSTVGGVFTPDDSSELEPNDALSLANVSTELGPEVYVANGQLWETNGDFAKALEQYGRALEIEPENAAALASVARLHDRQGNVDQAIEYFQKAISSEPSDPGLYSDLGMLLSKIGRHDDAAAQLQKAIAIAPKTKRYANNLAIVLMEAGQRDNAFAVLTHAHEPAKAHYNMAYLEYQHQNLERTRTHLQQAVALDPTLQPARDLLARVGGSQVAQTAQNAYDTASAIATSPLVQGAITGATGASAEAGQSQTGAEAGNASAPAPASSMRIATRPTGAPDNPATAPAPQTPPAAEAPATPPSPAVQASDARDTTTAAANSDGATIRLTDSKPAESTAPSPGAPRNASGGATTPAAEPSAPPSLQLPPSLMPSGS